MSCLVESSFTEDPSGWFLALPGPRRILMLSSIFLPPLRAPSCCITPTTIDQNVHVYLSSLHQYCMISNECNPQQFLAAPYELRYIISSNLLTMGILSRGPVMRH